MDDIKTMLNTFVETKRIPNIIFHGPNCVGKRSILLEFISKIYNGNKDVMRENVMMVNCAYGKGIRFIREELKFFAKSNLGYGRQFKSIILSNADNLTIDAQSALRRCIEVFSHSTRFFMIAENKYKLLSPILSRFCEIHVPETFINGRSTLPRMVDEDRVTAMAGVLEGLDAEVDMEKLMDVITDAFRKGMHSFHFIEALKARGCTSHTCDTLMKFDECRAEFRDERLLMLFIMNYHYRASLSSEQPTLV